MRLLTLRGEREATRFFRRSKWCCGVVAARGTCAKLAMPLVGFVSPVARDLFATSFRPFLQGLSESGYVEGRNVVIDTIVRRRVVTICCQRCLPICSAVR